MSVKVNDKLPGFKQSLYNTLNDALADASKDILIKAKIKAPLDKGGLRANSENKQMARLFWRISFWKEYARFQEFGGDKKRVVRNYSTPGTGKRYLSKSGDEYMAKMKITLKKHTVRARP
jgi:hypothetical protein